MKTLIPAFVAVVLLVAASAQACNPVAAIVAQPVYAQQIVAAPIVYQPQVVQAFVAPVSYAVAAPVVVQQVVVRQRIVHRHPMRNALRVGTPPFGRCNGRCR